MASDSLFYSSNCTDFFVGLAEIFYFTSQNAEAVKKPFKINLMYKNYTEQTYSPQNAIMYIKIK